MEEVLLLGLKDKQVSAGLKHCHELDEPLVRINEAMLT
jgi:hypothetical protein